VVPAHEPPLMLRRPSPEDREALLALVHADEMDAVGRTSVTGAEIDEALVPVHTTLDEDQWLAVGEDGHLHGWVLLWDQGSHDHLDVEVYRDPQRADESVRGALLDLALERIGQRARAGGYDHIVLDVGCVAGDERYAATLRSRGLRRSRTFYRLRIDLDQRRPLPRPQVDGVRLGPFDGSEDGWRQLHAVLEEAFVDHYSFSPTSYESYRADAESEPVPDREFWRVAWADEAMVGVCRASGRNAELGGGYVTGLAVLPSHRGRGIGRALLSATFEAYREAGRTWGQLGVDTENSTGALRLYESIGMQRYEEVHAYQLAVPALGAPQPT